MTPTRRKFLRFLAVGGGGLALGISACKKRARPREKVGNALSTVYRSVNGSPDRNTAKVIEMMGGIGSLVGTNDVVVIKPNARWWNQGSPNLLSLKTLVETIMERPGGFRGEVVLTENVHLGPKPWESIAAGWAHPYARNSDIADVRNLDGLAAHLKARFGDRFSTCHLIDVGAGGRRVSGPADGPGYVFCDGTAGVPLISCDNGREGAAKRAVIMTYPIIETDRGTVIDLKDGIWKSGAYTGQPLKFINLAAVNSHSLNCGATSAVKNYLGLSDLTGGPDPHDGGRLTGDFCNFHSFAYDKWKAGPVPGMLGKEIGTFWKTIRKADLNITTAEWVGLASRSELPVAHTRAVLASTDAVALDYHAFKYILFANSGAALHDPDRVKSEVHQYLRECAEMGGGTLDEGRVDVESFDLRASRLQRDDELSIKSDKAWGNNARDILKYLALRHFYR